MAARQGGLDEKLGRAERQLRLVGDALARLGGKSVWFVVEPTKLSYSEPPIARDSCFLDKSGPARISAEGLGQIVKETLATLAEARKKVGGAPPEPQGRMLGRSRAKR